MRYKLLYFIIANCISAIALANQVEVKVKGGIDFQTGWHKNNGTAKQQYVSSGRKSMGFNSAAHVHLDLQNKIDNFITYGATVAIETTAKNDRRIASFLYVISDYGKLELGSDKSAHNKMRITGYSVGCGTAGAWDSLASLTAYPNDIAYVSSFANFLDAKTRAGDKAEYSRKISYYTPLIHGIQLGISYIPDSSNTGYNSLRTGAYHGPIKPTGYKFVIKDGLAYGASYEGNIGEVKVKSSIVGETGSVKLYSKTNAPVDKTVSRLSNYTVGTELHYNQYSVACSYGNYNKSLTSARLDRIGRKTELYSIGGRYKYDKLQASLNYFTSTHKSNNLHAVTIAADYKLAQGFKTYAEVTYYKTNGKFLKVQNGNEISISERIKGAMLLLGAKLEF